MKSDNTYRVNDNIAKLAQDVGFFNVDFYLPLREELREWLEKKHFIFIELKVEGWYDDPTLNNSLMAYSGSVYTKRIKKYCGISKYHIVYDATLYEALKLIEKNK